MSAPDTNSLEALLRPSLTNAPLQRPYSVRACYLVAFFGGALAIAIFGALTARRMGTLSKDLWLFVATAVLYLVGLYWAADATIHHQLPAWLTDLGKPTQTLRYAFRAFGLVIVGVFYWMRKDIWRAAELNGDAPSPWQSGIVSVIVAGIVGALVAGSAGLWGFRG
jgi:hypothetical protein